MPLHIIERDITTMKVDAIVNSTNIHMFGFSGVDRIIHDIGGPDFEKECEDLVGLCKPGEAVHTNAYNMDCKYIIHTVSPGWCDGFDGEAAILRSCYRSSLVLAEKLGCRSVAFPLIAAGNMGYPIADAIETAVTSINEHLQLFSDMDVFLVLFGASVKRIAESKYSELDDYIKNNFQPESLYIDDILPPLEKPLDLEEMLSNPTMSFYEKLVEFMDARGIENDAIVYNSAHVLKQTFNRIKNKDAKPTMLTAAALAMALKLTYDEALELFRCAGITLSHHSECDIIVEFFLKTGNYSIGEMNTQLMKHGYKSIIGTE